MRRNRSPNMTATPWAKEVRDHTEENPTNAGVDCAYFGPLVAKARATAGKKRWTEPQWAELGSPPPEMFSRKERKSETYVEDDIMEYNEWCHRNRPLLPHEKNLRVEDDIDKSGNPIRVVILGTSSR